MRPSERNLLSVVVVALAHAALFTYVARSFTPPPPQADYAIDVSLMDGRGGSLPGVEILAPAAIAAPTVAAASAKPTEIPDPLSAPEPPSALQLAARLISASSPAIDLSAEISTDPEIATSAAPAAQASAQALAVQNAANAATGGDTCEIAGALQAAMQDSEPVQEALGRIPPESRSVANALLLWNGVWAGEASSGALRDVIRTGVLAEPDECRNRLVQGPRFISLATKAGTAVLVVGSGLWRWADLLADTASQP